MAARRYYRTWLEKRMTPLFGERDREPVVNWLVTHRARPKVIVVGSGFSRNAALAEGEVGEKDRRIPLWSDITRRLRNELGYFEENVGPQDPLLVAEQHQEALGMEKFAETLLQALKDKEIVPGAPHNALHRCNVEAIVTTNQLDTLLDRMHGNWFRVVTNTDLPVARARAEGSPAGAARQVIYLHGHRSNPTSWVFSRSQYESIEQTRPAVFRRVQQLLSEYPLLVLGYSLSDPDFHALFGRVHEEQSGYMPRALCVTVGKPPMEGERAHWQRMGMHLAHLSGVEAAGPSVSGASSSEANVGSALEYLLTLDDVKPEAQYVVNSIEAIQGSSLDDTLGLRLEEYREIFHELEDLVIAPGEVTQLQFNAWATCLPSYATFRSESDLNIRLPQPPGSLQELKPLRWDVERSSLTNLPEFFQDLMSGQARALLLAIDRFLSDGGAQAVLSEWLGEAQSRRLRATDREGLGDPISSALSYLFMHFRPGGGFTGVQPSAEIAMGRAYLAALAGDLATASEHYHGAAIEFAGRGDAVGEWYGRVSRRIVLQLEEQLASKERRDFSAQIQQEQASIHRLERSRAVINERERRSGITSRGYEYLSSKANKEPNPLAFSYDLSVVPSELFQLLREDQALGVVPQLSREPASVWVKLEADEALETIETGIRYFSPDLPVVLEREKGRDLGEQREHDAQLCARLEGFLNPLHPLASTAHLCPAMAAVLGHTALRLSSEAIEKSLRWLEKERSRSERAFVHTFGVTSTSNVDRIVVSLALNLRSGGEDAWSFLKRYTLSTCATDDLTVWQSAAGAGWSVLLARTPETYEEIVQWHMNKCPTDHRVLQSWLQSMGNLLRTGTELCLLMADTTKSTILEFAQAKAETERSFLGIVEAILGQDSVVETLRSPPKTWSEEDRRQAAINLAEAGEQRADRLDAQFREELEAAVAATVTRIPNDDLYELDAPFALVSACLALQIGERDNQVKWIRQTVALFERAPLFMLAHAIKLGRWTAESERQQLRIALLDVPSTIREFHLLRLGNSLCNPLVDSSCVLGGEFLAELASMASRSIHAVNRAHATMATNCLISLLNQGARVGLSPERWDYLVGALRRCALHPRTAVRATAALRLGELSMTGLDDAFRNIAASLLLGEAGVVGLQNDHSSYVVNFADYGLKKGKGARESVTSK